MLPNKIYQKETNRNIPKLIGESLRDLNKSRFLAYQLAKRDISAQYRQSYLGILWAFIEPLVIAMVWVILNSSGTVRLTETGVPYPVYAFAGTLIWSMMVEAINAPIKNTTAAKTILTKINFPKEALIISGILKLLFNSAIKLVLLLCLILIFGIELSWGLLLFPIAALGGLLFAITFGLFLTPIGMLYQDISKLITFGMQFLMYATPVVYAVPKTGVMKTIMELNPLTPIITVGRNLAVNLPLSYLNYFFIVVGLSIPLFFLALVFYRLSIPIFVERLSA